MVAATQTVSALVSLEEYLRTAYDPDCDYVDGHIEERTLGETNHGLLQGELVFWFRSHKDEWHIRVIPELRTRVSQTRVRIPDVTVAMDDSAMREQVRATPPLVAIEVLSPEDRIPRLTQRLHDFFVMGIPNIWVLDPADRTASTYSGQVLQRVWGDRISVPNSPIYVDLPAIFSALD